MVIFNYDIYREQIEKTYEGTASISEMQDVKDPVTHISSKEEVVVLPGEPCRLSFKTIKSADENDAAASSTQEVKLFISPDITVNPGSKITVVQGNLNKEYERSGEPAIYPTHQEIVLKSFNGWT